MSVVVRLVGPEGTDEREFSDEEADQVCRPTSLELLRTVAREEPSSIREVARLVDRDVRQVHDDRWTLGSLDLVEFDRGGRSHRPVVDDERVELAIGV